MSLSHFQRPLDVVHHPQFEPEVKRSILASWASDAHTVDGKPALRRPPDVEHPVSIDEVMDALRRLTGAGTDHVAAISHLSP